MSTTIFKAEQFTPTEHSTAEDKAKFANHYVRFVKSDFKATLFSKWFYCRLSMCFGHIAHYDQDGFYNYWFTALLKKRYFVLQALEYPCYGDSDYTYSDVEKEIKKWLREEKWLESLTKALRSEEDAAERAEYERLRAKFGGVES